MDLKMKAATLLETTNKIFVVKQFNRTLNKLQSNTYFSGVENCIVFYEFLMHDSCQWTADMHAAHKICLLRHHVMI